MWLLARYARSAAIKRYSGSTVFQWKHFLRKWHLCKYCFGAGCHNFYCSFLGVPDTRDTPRWSCGCLSCDDLRKLRKQSNVINSVDFTKLTHCNISKQESALNYVNNYHIGLSGTRKRQSMLCNVLLHLYIISIFSTPGSSVSSLPD